MIREGISRTVPGSSVIQATNPDILKAIFDFVPIYREDVLVDLGCGDGDVIQHWLEMGLDNTLIGIEMDFPTFLATVKRFKQDSNVQILWEDASLGHPWGTLFYMFNPFQGEQMRRLERNLPYKCRVIYNGTHDMDIWRNWNIVPIPNDFRAVVMSR